MMDELFNEFCQFAPLLEKAMPDVFSYTYDEDYNCWCLSWDADNGTYTVYSEERIYGIDLDTMHHISSALGGTTDAHTWHGPTDDCRWRGLYATEPRRICTESCGVYNTEHQARLAAVVGLMKAVIMKSGEAMREVPPLGETGDGVKA